MSTLPQDLDAELSVLSTCARHVECVTRVKAVLTSEMFADISHQYIFEVICKLHDRGMFVDAITFKRQLKELGYAQKISVAKFSKVLIGETSVDGVESHAQLVREEYERRMLTLTLVEGEKQLISGESTALGVAEKVQKKLSERVQVGSEQQLSEACLSLIDHLSERAAEPNKIWGLTTGFYDLDSRFMGLEDGVHVIAGRPGDGKTSFALNIVENQLYMYDDVHVLFFSFEMSQRALLKRLVCSKCKVDSKQLNVGGLKPYELERVQLELHALGKKPLVVVEASGWSAQKIDSYTRAWCQSRPAQTKKLVVIDYLQLVRSMFSDKDVNRDRQISEIMSVLLAITQQIGLPIIALSQLNRDVEKGGTKKKRERLPPQMSDLRESGSIENDAWTISMLHKPEVETEEQDALTRRGIEARQLFVRKNRDGDASDAPINLLFFAKWTRFESERNREPIDNVVGFRREAEGIV